MGDSTPILRYLLIVMLLATACHSPKRINQSVNFFSVARIPVVEGRINGKVAYFIVDTGASCSILNESVARHYGFKTLVSVDEHLMGLNGAAGIKLAYNYSIDLGSLRINSLPFRSRRIDELVDVIKNNDRISIAGIIGSDVMKKYQMSIDYRTNKISFMQRVSSMIMPETVTMSTHAGND